MIDEIARFRNNTTLENGVFIRLYISPESSPSGVALNNRIYKESKPN